MIYLHILVRFSVIVILLLPEMFQFHIKFGSVIYMWQKRWLLVGDKYVDSLIKEDNLDVYIVFSTLYCVVRFE